MARLALTAVTPVGPYPTGQPTANTMDYVFAAPAVPADGVSVQMTGREILLVRNKHATTAGTFTLASMPDQKGRTQDVTAYSLAAGEFAAFDARSLEGWRQVDGSLYAAGSTVDIEFAVLRLAF